MFVTSGLPVTREQSETAGATSSRDVTSRRPKMTGLSAELAAFWPSEHLAVGGNLYHVKPDSVIVCDADDVPCLLCQASYRLRETARR